MKKIKYDPDHHGSFEEEWGIHKGCREWWYSTSVLTDGDGNLYTCQYTLLHLSLGLFTPKVPMVALTDYQNCRHYYLQTMPNKKEAVYIDAYEASVNNVASAVKEKEEMKIRLYHKDFDLNLSCRYGKAPVWHCENGKLQMGIPDKGATTLYYSWTNMPTDGILHLGGKEIRLTGKTWFDKQGGTYNMADMRSHWEWFSLRFFDDEEAMLFTFPHNPEPEYDGTFIASDGSFHRLNSYQIRATSRCTFKGLEWSAGWELEMPEKEKFYTIEPLQEGHMNFAYFEELCAIKNRSGETVGYAFAELLPGVLNQERLKLGGKSELSMKNLFARVEI